MWRGLYGDVLKLLKADPVPRDQPDLAVSTLTLLGVAELNTHNFAEAERLLSEADQLCGTSDYADCGFLLQAHGLLATEKNQSAQAEQFYQASLAFARSHGDKFLEADSLLNLGAESLNEGHFDEAIDRSEAAYQLAQSIDAGLLELVTQGNIGWAYYRLGDSDKALQLFLEAEKRAGEFHNYADRGAWLTDAGYVYMGARNFIHADQAFQQALEMEQRANSKEEIYNVLRARARLALETGDLPNASQFAQQALTIARESDNHIDELYPMLVQGNIAARHGDVTSAQKIFRAVEQDQACPVFLKWEALHSLARLYEDNARTIDADREYRLALTTFESARDAVRHESSQLSFLTNAAGIYNDYVHFLVKQKRPDEALRWADYSRARTLAQGLGLLSQKAAKEPPALNARAIARRAGGNILFYWLGDKASYLWAISPQNIECFQLPPGTDIEAAAQRYRRALTGPNDMLETGNPDGRWLYATLLEPAKSFLPDGARIFIIPDGALNNQNFETLIVSDPKLHYWIEDQTVVNASSLRVLAASAAAQKRQLRNLLLVGNSIAPNERYPELPKAAAQMESVAAHFQPGQRMILARERATPAGYLQNNPEQFSYIHFVAHGTASRLSPLDSAIVLSKSGDQSESFKLYARDIIRHPLHADLVTISSCYGAGERAYSGEGLVGLSWAFLRAGAHNVIAALWEATDASTEQLMAAFYEELEKGASPDAALRNAKLSLLRSRGFRNPFYWAPFQLYAGS
jgi:CHAT domain-containing protein